MVGLYVYMLYTSMPRNTWFQTAIQIWIKLSLSAGEYKNFGDRSVFKQSQYRLGHKENL